jgi:hypothetical protein
VLIINYPMHTSGMGVIEDLGPGPAPAGLPWELKIGQRVVGVPWPSAEGPLQCGI